MKNKIKFFSIVLAILLVLSTITFATADTIDPQAEDNNSIGTEAEQNSTSNEGNIVHKDLYIAESNAYVREFVNGNIFVFGSNVNISGKVNGNAFVFGDRVTFTETSEITQSLFVFGTDVSFAGQVTDVYAAASNLNIASTAIISRDLKCFAEAITLSGIVGRDSYVASDSIIIPANENPQFSGDFNYYSSSEFDIPEGIVAGDINYIPISEDNDTEESKTISDYIFSLLTAILTSLVLYLLATVVTPKFVEKSSAYASTKGLLALLFGFLFLVVAPVITLILFLTSIGYILGFILLGIYIVLLLCASSIVTISVSQKVVELRKIDNKYMKTLVVVLVSIIVWVIKQVPYIGGFIGFLIMLLGLGIALMSCFAKKDKNNTEIVKTTEQAK